MYISYCEECARRQNGHRAMTAVSREYFGACQGACLGTQGAVKQYEIGPTWAEIERRKRQRRQEENRRGGGERARAETRSGR